MKRPVLRYHGGKWKLAPWIISFFPRHRIYVEPFGGAASVLIRKNQSFAEIYNELDSEVWNVFKVLRNPETAEALQRQLSLTPYSRKEFIEAYNGAGEAIERARRTIVKLHMGFGNDSLGRARHGGMRTRATVLSIDWVSGRCEAAGFNTSQRLGDLPSFDRSIYPTVEGRRAGVSASAGGYRTARFGGDALLCGSSISVVDEIRKEVRSAAIQELQA